MSPPTEVPLEDFLAGLFAGLVFKEKTRVRGGPGVLDEALYWTVRDLEKMRKRQRVHFPFRIARKALAAPGGSLASALERLQGRGLIRLPSTPTGDIDILMNANAAQDVLRDAPAMIDMANWAATCFLRRHATARVHPLRRGARPPAAGAADA